MEKINFVSFYYETNKKLREISSMNFHLKKCKNVSISWPMFIQNIPYSGGLYPMNYSIV